MDVLRDPHVIHTSSELAVRKIPSVDDVNSITHNETHKTCGLIVKMIQLFVFATNSGNSNVAGDSDHVKDRVNVKSRANTEEISDNKYECNYNDISNPKDWESKGGPFLEDNSSWKSYSRNFL